MRLTRLHLRNYRVYEDPLDLEIPPGLVGIYGPNGAGKSVLLEAILFCLYGRARTAKDEIRTSGINADCITEVEFEHEGHLYTVRRTITGQNATVRAQAHTDGAQVAEGVRDTSRYVHSVLGMDDVAFRASVFAEQKQLAAFSSHQPAERRKLVLQLLGITPLDAARDQVRKDARSARDQLTQLRRLLPDRSAIAAELDTLRAAAADEEGKVAAADVAAADAKAAAETAAGAVDSMAEVGREYEGLVRDGKTMRAERDRAAARAKELADELASLGAAEARLAELVPVAAGLDEAERTLKLVTAAVEAGRALDQLPEPAEPERPDEDAAEVLRRAAEDAANRLAELDGQLSAARSDLERAGQAAERSAGLSGEEDCPLCGQALGEAFDQVRRHRHDELADARRRVDEVEAERRRAKSAADSARADAKTAIARLKAASAAWKDYELAVGRRGGLVAARDKAVAALGRHPEEGEPARLAAEVTERRAAAEECARLRGRLERRPKAEADLASEQERVADLDGRLENLRDKVKALDFRPERLEGLKAKLAGLRQAQESAAAEAQGARLRTVQARSAADACALRLADADEAHARLGETEQEARHLDRLSDLLSAFRNTVVATVGPRLSSQAAELFSELTDHEYDRLEVDPDSYEIQIRDSGVAYGMDRFSGSETDLANLALRVAISEQVRFQSGGAVGLLVLDEVFGPLDGDRKERMLLALERLRGRFRQVLVVTHDAEIKEQLPNAIEVVKLRGRRATARVLNA